MMPQLTAIVTPAERAEIRDRAAREKVSVSNYIRRLLKLPENQDRVWKRLELNRKSA